jgi:surface protein
MEREINTKLRNMTKSQLEKVCGKMRCPKGTRKDMIRYIMLPLRNNKYKMENTCDECVICLNEVNTGKPPEKTICGHCFHRDCLEKWTKINNTCPMCRRVNPQFTFQLNDQTLKGAVREYLRDERSAIRKYGDISKWDVSNVTDMGYMFKYARSFNGDLSKWNVSNVRNMNGMFMNAKSFNGDLSKWNVSNMFYMGYMFKYAESFNGDLSKWDVSNVINIESMFEEAKSFNGDLSKWNVSNVRDMGSMFEEAKSFNGDISKWNVSNVRDMEDMFYKASSFDIKNAPWYSDI